MNNAPPIAGIPPTSARRYPWPKLVRIWYHELADEGSASVGGTRRRGPPIIRDLRRAAAARQAYEGRGGPLAGPAPASRTLGPHDRKDVAVMAEENTPTSD